MPDTTLPLKKSGHGVFVIVHTLVSKCKVGQQWGCLSRRNIIQCVGVGTVLPHQNQQQSPKINKKKMQNTAAQFPVNLGCFSAIPEKQSPRRESLLDLL